jgi:hypothetical protein
MRSALGILGSDAVYSIANFKRERCCKREGFFVRKYLFLAFLNEKTVEIANKGETGIFLSRICGALA